MTPSNVLIVDDSPYLHKIIRAHLGNDSLVMHSAYDGETALTKVADLQPDLVLMDIDMPRMDGLEACRQLKANPQTADAPVIFLTADCSTYDKVKAFEMGAVDFITKPFQPEEVRARVRAALRVKSVNQQLVMIDTITGLWNQNYLDVLLPSQVALAKRTGQPLSCVVSDIDEMDHIYDAHGRAQAERIIKSITGTFAGMSRSEDVLCHLGGGRIVSLQPATSQSDAALLADLIRSEIERQVVYSEFTGTKITCSFGVAESRNQWTGSPMEAAQEALEQAKQAHGNVVIPSMPWDRKSLAA